MRIISAALLMYVSLFHAHAAAARATAIVSLDLCTDWMLLTYAAPGQVKAYSPYLYRYDYDWIPAGLPTHNASLEQVLALKPDLIISGEFNALLMRRRLEQLNLRTAVVYNPTSLEGVADYVQQFNRLLGRDLASAEVAPRSTPPARGQSLLLLGPNGIGTGRDTLEHDILNAAGWTNYLQRSGYVMLELEQLISNPPDAVYWSGPQSRSIAAQFGKHRALRQRMDPQQWINMDSWRWLCPGPWTYELIQELAAWKNP
jgi:iron complex transport system substrate-binding protein